MKVNKVVFISDLDGTLIHHDEEGGRICEESLTVIREQIANGMTFCIATGRNVADVICHPELAEVASYIIANNGSEVYDARGGELQKIFQGKQMPVQIVKELFALAVEHPVYRVIVTPTSYLCENNDEKYLDFDFRAKSIENAHEMMERGEAEAIKVSFVGQPQVIQDLYDILTHYYADFFDITISANICIDINAKGITKGNGIEFLKQHLQLPEDMIVGAVGDNGNDISMVNATHYSFAMENGIEELRQQVHHVVKTVGEAIETMSKYR